MLQIEHKRSKLQAGEFESVWFADNINQLSRPASLGRCNAQSRPGAGLKERINETGFT